LALDPLVLGRYEAAGGQAGQRVVIQCQKYLENVQISQSPILPDNSCNWLNWRNVVGRCDGALGFISLFKELGAGRLMN
jgi:hypothetical protein